MIEIGDNLAATLMIVALVVSLAWARTHRK